VTRYRNYKIAIWILSILLIFESILLLRFWITFPKKIPKIPPIAIKGKIAIVIDDWGYNLDHLDILSQIKYPFTASVLPNLNYSQGIAEILHKKGLQIILHLPMEPYEKYRLEQNTIMASMDSATIERIVNHALQDVPYTVGVSNHMGSKATEDLRTMQIIFKELKSRHLYFLDSLVSTKSICADLALKLKLPFAKRDVFLDNKEEYGYIKQQIEKLKTRARIQGEALGIGHDCRITLEVLKEVMPVIEKEGYQFIFVSDLVR